MKKLLLIIAVLWASAANAQLALTGAGKTGSSGPPPSYTGPGDVVSGALGFWSPARAYNAAYAGSKLANECNSTGGTDVACADILSSATTGAAVPQSISGVTCPGNANCTIKTVYDQISTNNHTQSTVASRWTTLSSPQGSGYCGVTNGSQFEQASTYFAQSMGFTMSLVTKRTANFSGIQWVWQNSFGGISFGYDNANTIFMYDSASVPTAPATDSAYHSFQAIYDNPGALSSVYVDGSNTLMALGGTQALGNGNNALGTQAGGGSGATVNFCEQGVWAGDFNSTQAANMTSNQRTFYSF